MTNFEKIMKSPEAFVEAIGIPNKSFADVSICRICKSKCGVYSNNKCSENILEWLNADDDSWERLLEDIDRAARPTGHNTREYFGTDVRGERHAFEAYADIASRIRKLRGAEHGDD